MFLDINSIMVNNISMGPYITEAKYGYNKLWSSDSGRNLAGSMTGTLVGIFPKITLQFRKLTKSELETIVPLLDSATQNVRYYDPKKGAYITIQTYTGDYEITNKGFVSNNRKNDGFSCSFIARKKRG
jgi:hypothetical protein